EDELGKVSSGVSAKLAPRTASLVNIPSSSRSEDELGKVSSDIVLHRTQKNSITKYALARKTSSEGILLLFGAQWVRRRMEDWFSRLA
ncbi:MAG: hypothetical protein MJZ63_07490, partial [Muribaculaceae bacterium]|nr:hypothetical protein [Muribaculaceae bacterium]